MVPGRTPDLRAAGDALSSDSRVFVVFNPASGRGRGARRIARYRRLLEEHVPAAKVGITTRPGEERDLTDRALDEGFDTIAAAGGDGTWSNVADRILASGRSDVALGLLPNGTGNDFGRNLGFDPDGAAEAVRVLAAGRTRRVDVGRVDSPSASEHAPDAFGPRHFLNVVGFGFDVAVIDAAANARFLKGELLYKLTALQQLRRFPGVRLGLRSDHGGPESLERCLMVTVSNGRYFGGGFPVAPGATVDDGMLHACSILDAPPLTRFRLFNLAEKGRHIESDRVRLQSGPDFELSFDQPVRFEVDGDVRRSRDATVRLSVLAGALWVVAPAA